MSTPHDDWDQRVADLWSTFEAHEAEDFVQRVEALAAERPAGDAAALFERGCAQDSTGHPAEAIVLYRAALDAGVTGIRRRRAMIQMASSLRNLGRPEESVALLTKEMGTSDELDDAVRAVLALALADVGRAREGVGIAVGALARHLPRYQKSMARYAAQLAAGEK